MSIITLTSDLGHKDFYVAAVKAAILSQAPTATIVDISHLIKPFDIHDAAFQLLSVFRDFPLGSIHIIGINSQMLMDQPHVVVHYMGHYFISADNGIFGLLLESEPADIFEIGLPQGENWNFPMKGVFATAAAHIAKGGKPEFLGRRIQDFHRAIPNMPMQEENAIKGHVVFIDHYGNVYTNITKTFFQSVARGRTFAISFKSHNNSIHRISSGFEEVIQGELLAMWAGNDHLLIALNGGVIGHGGSASQLFALKPKDIVRVDFS
jgi:S-adenosylmethionine hydrolase